MSPHPLQDTIALLTRTPAALDSLLRDLPETWTSRNEGGETWTVFEVLGHVIHADQTDWMPRVRTILEHGESRPFTPFDREGQRHLGGSLSERLDQFARVRAEQLAALRSLDLTESDLDRRGRHPSLGSVTLSQLLATWAAHDLTHLHQISRIMAHQFRDAVGPWAAFLGVMQCAGHSSS
jgi:hypothetical protein